MIRWFLVGAKTPTRVGRRRLPLINVDRQKDLPDGIQGCLTLIPAETSAHRVSEFNRWNV